MRRTAAIVLMLLAIACASGAAPRAVIRGPASGPLNRFVILDGTGSAYDGNGVKWVLEGSNQNFLAAGPQAVFMPQVAGTYRFLLICAGTVDGALEVDIASHPFTAGSSPPPGPAPGPNPPPGPGPGPPEPDLAGLSKDVHAWASAIPPPDRTIAGDIGQNFADVAAAVSAGVLKDPAAIVKETHTRNLATQGDKRAAWQAFFQKLQARLNTLAQSNDLKSTDQHAVLWREIAAGLKAVK